MKQFSRISIAIVLLILLIECFRFYTGFFPSKWMNAIYEELVEEQVLIHEISAGYQKEDIVVIKADSDPKVRKGFDVTIISRKNDTLIERHYFVVARKKFEMSEIEN